MKMYCGAADCDNMVEVDNDWGDGLSIAFCSQDCMNDAPESWPNKPVNPKPIDEAKHTPGPWKLHHEDTTQPYIGTVEASPFAKFICNMNRNIPLVGEHIVVGISKEEGLANARLIAATPDYHRAAILAKKSASRLGTPDGAFVINSEAYYALLAAIAKATGAE